MRYFENVCAVISQEFGVQVEYITPESRLDSFGIDSLDLLSCIVEIDRVFNIEIPMTDIANVVKVGDLVELVEKLSTGMGAAA